MNFIQVVLPIIIIIESILASIILLYSQKYGSALYWFSAGMLNISVVFLINRLG